MLPNKMLVFTGWVMILAACLIILAAAAMGWKIYDLTIVPRIVTMSPDEKTIFIVMNVGLIPAAAIALIWLFKRQRNRRTH